MKNNKILNKYKNKMDFNKTDEELKKMSDDKLFEYLDAKAEIGRAHV